MTLTNMTPYVKNVTPDGNKSNNNHKIDNDVDVNENIEASYVYQKKKIDHDGREFDTLCY